MTTIANYVGRRTDLVGLHVRSSGQSINAWLNPSAIQGGKDRRKLQGWWEEPNDAQLGYDVPNKLIEYQGETYRFCGMTDNHLAVFQTNPEYYLQRLESRAADARVHRDPVCNMDIGEDLFAEFEGRR